MSDDPEKDQEQSEIETRISKIDKACDVLLSLIEAETTSDAQKGRLFAQVVSWAKVKDKLIPPDDGNKLRGMTDELKNGRRGGSSKRAAGSATPGESRNNDGHKIRKIIASLPAYGITAGGNPKDSKRAGSGDGGDAGQLRINGGGDGDADGDGVVGVH